jgi:lysophospholipase L1-like esterase
VRLKSVLAVFAIAVAPLCAQTRWVATWSSSASPQLTDEGQLQSARLIFENQTLRQVVHTSIGGSTVRVRLSNVYNSNAVAIGAAHIALRSSAQNIVADSDRVLTFAGRAAITLPPNASVLSDPLTLDVPAAGDLAISLFFPQKTWPGGIHYLALQTNYIGTGDQTGRATFTRAANISNWVFLAGVDVAADDGAGAILTLGDSITDGANSTADTNQRWPNFLATRLLAASGERMAVANAGISGNRVLHDAIISVRSGANALARLEHDVLSQPGARYLIVLEGINDIGQPGTTSADITETVTADEIINGLALIVARAHEMGLTVYGATLTPFAVATSVGYFSPEKEVKRKAVNQWIRTGGAFDAVIDFEAAVRDPANPDSMLPAFDSGDHLHPGNAGYKAMADAIDLSLFQ